MRRDLLIKPSKQQIQNDLITSVIDAKLSLRLDFHVVHSKSSENMVDTKKRILDFVTISFFHFVKSTTEPNPNIEPF